MMGEFIIGILNTSVVVGLSIALFSFLLSFRGKRYNAKCRKTIWILMAICLLIPFRFIAVSGTYTAEIPHVVLREAEIPDTGHAAYSIADSASGSVEQNLLRELTSGEIPQAQLLSGVLRREITVADVLFVVWACVAAAMAVYYMAGYWRMRRKIRRWGFDCEDEGIQRILVEVSGQYRMKRIPELRILQDSTVGPFTTGVLKNIIVLPEEARIEKDVRFIIKHEVLHCKNKDILWKLLFLFVNIIHWFNPLVWVLRRAAEQDMEIACDEEVVLRATREVREEYSEVLMSWVERSQYRGSAVSSGYVHGVRFLKRRFESIINGGRKKKGILLIGAACVFIMLIGNMIHVRSGEKDVQENPVSMQVFAPEDVMFKPEIVPYDYESACEMGEVRQMRGMLPGTGEGIWYTITVDGVEYYYARYDDSADKTELFGFAIVSGEHSLANGIFVGMTKSELLERYPDMRIEDTEGNVLNGMGDWTWWNNTSYPSSRMGMDEEWDYGGAEYYYWDSQFDYIMIAEIEQPMDTLPISMALMMKNDTVSAITFYYPTAG